MLNKRVRNNCLNAHFDSACSLCGDNLVLSPAILTHSRLPRDGRLEQLHYGPAQFSHETGLSICCSQSTIIVQLGRQSLPLVSNVINVYRK